MRLLLAILLLVPLFAAEESAVAPAHGTGYAEVPAPVWAVRYHEAVMRHKANGDLVDAKPIPELDALYKEALKGFAKWVDLTPIPVPQWKHPTKEQEQEAEDARNINGIMPYVARREESPEILIDARVAKFRHAPWILWLKSYPSYR